MYLEEKNVDRDTNDTSSSSRTGLHRAGTAIHLKPLKFATGCSRRYVGRLKVSCLGSVYRCPHSQWNRMASFCPRRLETTFGEYQTARQQIDGTLASSVDRQQTKRTHDQRH